ncbi:ABC-type multidrug transport system [Paramagnetospirillum magneticum AMB-1]|uniref:ABC-type multidrug transport system n=1 Tax=Paramagnetospirillum magneticum (strain ATCC 700264 / AMB-1) TaxID=342108 RepID=Q2W7A6_PARM1|nr:ABC-type multidrug transport system [Paramagnetospirillum magneticum AMB-1]
MLLGEISSETAAAQFVRLVRDLTAFAGSRLALVMAGASVMAAAEGIGLLLLVPLLGLLGITGSPGMLAEWLGPTSIELALALYVGLIGGAAMVVAGCTLAASRLRMDYVDDLRCRLHRALMGMEWQAFSRLRGAEVTRVLTDEAVQAAHGVQFLLNLTGWLLEVAVLMAVAARLSLVMTAGVLALVLVGGLLARSLHRRTHLLGKEQGRTGKAWQAALADNLAGMRVIRAFGMEGTRHAVFVGAMTSLRATQRRFLVAVATAAVMTRAGAAIAVALALVVATRGFGLPLADTAVLLLAYIRLLSTLLKIQEGWRVVLLALPAHAGAMALLAHCRAAAEDGDEQPPCPLDLRGEIRLEGVGYRHSEDRPAALRHISAVIPARRMTALIGESGAGKSTLADILLGLTVPSEGCLRVDGTILDGALRRQWRSRVGYVPQDGFLFHDTIRTNLLAAAPHADEPALWRALEQAAAAGFVRHLPQGLDTVVGDRGARLSGGERQRLTLARALLSNPALLILDEATSALDAGSERLILDALDHLRGELTVVVIAHRPSMVERADHVLVLEQGQLVAAGTWTEVGGAVDGTSHLGTAPA